MNLDTLSFALSQITYLTANLNKKNFKSSQTEISNVSSAFSFYAFCFLNNLLSISVCILVNRKKWIRGRETFVSMSRVKY